LVLVDAAIGLADQPLPPCDSEGGAGLLAWRGLRTLLVGAVGTEPAFSAFWLRQFVARKEVVTPERTALYQQPFASRGFSASLGDWALAFAAGCERPASATPEGFRALRVPTSLLWGDLDTITPLPQGERLQALAPRARLTVLKGVGHIPQIEDVAGFNAALVRVLATPP
jgi:pimeloyl-ACP methyl ester carboxylesterase